MYKQKNGFTIVELVVVLAVLAILTAVLIPTFSSVINKANITRDMQLCRILNEDIATGINNEKLQLHATYNDVIEYLSPRYNLKNLTPTSTGDIVWDMNTNTFSLIENGKFVYVGNPKTEKYYNYNGTNIKLWKIVDSIPSVENQNYSLYLNENANVTNVNVVVGFDAGTNTNVKYINYDRTSVPNTEAQEVTFRTNGGTLTINAENDSVNHYGSADKINIIAVANSSYHENGNVPNIEIAKGRIVVEDDASVNVVVVTGNNVKVDTQDENVLVKTAESVTGTQITGTQNTYNVKLVSNLNELQDDSNIVLNSDLTTTQAINASNITLDLNGHSIITGSTSLYVNGTNVKLVGSGLIKSTRYIPIILNKNSGLIIEGIEAQGQEGAVLATGFSNLVINSGIFTAYDNGVIMTNGSNNDNYRNYNITINGGIFNGYIQTSGYIACGVYQANNGTIVLNNGVFNIFNGCGILCRSGSTTIEENVIFNLFNDTDNPVRGKVGDSHVMVLTGASIVKDNVAHYPGGEPIVENNSTYAITELNSYN